MRSKLSKGFFSLLVLGIHMHIQAQPDQTQQIQPDQTQQAQATQGQPAQTQQAQPAPLPPGTIDNMVAIINGFRATLNLPPLQRWTDGEACANQSAQVDAQRNQPHFSFDNGSCPGVLAQNTCPGWPSLDSITQDQPNFLSCLHSMWNEGPPPTTPCTGDCFAAHGHFINMSNPQFTKVAIGIFQMPNGNFWININFQ